MKPAVTIRDLAARLGVSHSTVSRALGDHPAISGCTRNDVRALAATMGYVPNASARLMRGGRSTLVGLLIPDIQNDFYAHLAKALTDSLAPQGCQLLLSVTEDDPERELRDVHALRAARASCVVLVPSATPHAATLRLLRDMPVVQLGRTVSGIASGAVLMDDLAGTRAAALHLIGLGHTRIGFVGGQRDLSSHGDRYRGFVAALDSAGLAADPTLVRFGAPRPGVGHEAVQALMKGDARPTALILGSSELTLGALEALAELGLRWPDDVSLVGYGDPTWFALMERGLTTVRLPTAAVGAATAARVAVLAASVRPRRGSSSRAVERFDTTLVVRASTAPPSAPRSHGSMQPARQMRGA